MKKSSGKVVRYNKWGYIFLIPFIVVYVIFQLIPLVSTIYNSFFENYMSGLTQVGPKFVGLANYQKLFSDGDIWVYTKNTMVLWIMCFVPQIILSLVLGAWFSDVRLKLKGTRFFKTVVYLPNLIMASAFSMLFFTLFSDGGPINSMLMQIGLVDTPYKFLSNVGSARGLIALMNCLMWFGNTTILLMAGMMGIDTSLFEAAEVDGATSSQVFWQITLADARYHWESDRRYTLSRGGDKAASRLSDGGRPKSGRLWRADYSRQRRGRVSGLSRWLTSVMAFWLSLL